MAPKSIVASFGSRGISFILFIAYNPRACHSSNTGAQNTSSHLPKPARSELSLNHVKTTTSKHLTFGISFHILHGENPTHLSGIGQLRIDRLPLEKGTVAFTLPSEVGYEYIAMGGLAAFAKRLEFPPSRIEDLKTAVAEAYINAVQHGNQGKPDARVVVAFDFKDGVLGISVFDEGDGFKEPPRDPNIERIIENLDPPVGFGVFLMKRLMDKFEYRKSGDRLNEIRMIMKLGAPD